MLTRPYKPGITTITPAWNRLQSIANLLQGLLDQKLDGVGLEVILLNNTQEHDLRKSRFTKVGRLLRQFDDVKILNSSHNWRDSMRHSLAARAEYETVLFLDDDVMILDDTVLGDMYAMHKTLGPMDLLSPWNTLWTDWDDEGYSLVSLNLTQSEITEPIRCDTTGTNICMFNKQVVYSKRLIDVCSRSAFPLSGDTALGLIASMEQGSTVWYFPSYNRFGFHKQHTFQAMHADEGFYEQRWQLFKGLVKEGYVPVLERFNLDENSPERQIISKLEKRRMSW